MKTRLNWWLVLTLTGGLLGASAAAEQGPPTQPEKPVAPPKLDTFSGLVEGINVSTRTLTVRAVVIAKTFTVALDCRIVTRDKPEAGLEDLKTGEEVDVTYQDQAGLLVAQRIVHRGVGPVARDQAREKERLEKILNPNPSERPID